MTVPDTVRLKLAIADYFDAHGLPACFLFADALRDAMLCQLAGMDARDRNRRALLMTFRRNEKLCEDLARRKSSDPRVREHLEECEAILAQERAARRQKRETA